MSEPARDHVIAVVDEGLHEASDDVDWQESVYLAWRDQRAGFGGTHRIGNEVNRGVAGTSNTWSAVYADDGARYRCNDEDVPLELTQGQGLRCGRQQLVHDGQHLRFLIDDPACRVDFEVVDVPESVVVPGPRPAIGDGSDGGGVFFSGHFNARCRVRGTVEMAGRRAEIDAPAWRDHSWGVRRWDSFCSSRSFSGGDGAATHYGFYSVLGVDGTFRRGGVLVLDGRTLDVKEARMLVHLDDDGLRCPSAEIVYELGDGSTRQLRIDTIGGHLGVTRERMGWESCGDVSLDGRPIGWGFLEVNNNPRNGRDLPRVVLADGCTNGVVGPVHR